MPSYSESDVTSALNDMRNGISLRRAAMQHGVPRQTLSDRYHGAQSRNQDNSGRQRLSPVIEERLVTYILRQESIGYALNHGQVRSIVGKLLESQDDPEPLGKHWMDGFIRRHPELKTKLGRRIEYRRVNGASKENINKFFDLLDTFSWVKPANIWNVDETGIMEGQGVNGLVLRSSQTNPNSVYVKGNQSRSWTSIVECISATGKTLNPLVIFKAQSIQQQWFAKDLNEPSWQITHSENGWTSNEIALEWLERIFIPETNPEDSSDTRLLLVDGHGSHATEDFMFDCFKENIYLLFFPPHSSHVLQPLDIGVFSSLKAAYRRWLTEWAAATDSSPIGKLNFLRAYSKARKDAVVAKNIKSGFRGTGIYPKNRIKALTSPQVLDTTTAERQATPEPQQADSQLVSTPKNRKEVQELLDSIKKTPTTRRAFRKVVKVMDGQAIEIAFLKQRVRALEEESESLRASKRRKRVKEDPNSRFISIADIIAQRHEDEVQEIAESVAEEEEEEAPQLLDLEE